MKKLLYLLLLSALLLSGCTKKSEKTASAEDFRLTGGVTEAGVKAGDGPEEFIKAYEGYTIQVAYNEMTSSYLVMDIDDIPYDENISAIIATFFVDDEPVSIETLCSENGVDQSGLYELLSSHEYLRNHDVAYRYLLFQWEDGVISSISSDELNYNETFETPRIG